MFVGFIVAMVVAWRLQVFHGIFSSNNSEPLGVVLGAAVIFLCGLFDDLFEWSAPAKVAGMRRRRGVVLAYFGVTMYFFRIPFLGVAVPRSGPVAALDRAVARGDGQRHQPHRRPRRPGGRHRGHRVGHVLPLQRATRVDAGSSPRCPRTSGPSSPIIVLGICVGFLPHNFNPARIFMGDSVPCCSVSWWPCRRPSSEAGPIPTSRSSAARPTSSSPRCSYRS